MNHKLVFRFDIDTHKCIRDGVPNLLDISKERGVPFSFFLNAGRAVSLKESLTDILKRDKNTDAETDDHIYMMSALKKLGVKDYLMAALVNPKLIWYKNQVMMLCESECEVGLHGGKNHALWHKYARTWKQERIKDEIWWGLTSVKKVIPSFAPLGFASPGWESPDGLDSILQDLDFKYCADLRAINGNVIERTASIPYLGVNLLGEPGGVAFFENRRVQGKTTDDIVAEVLASVREKEVTIIYDHPYYAGVKELNTICRIITDVNDEGVEIATLKELI